VRMCGESIVAFLSGVGEAKSRWKSPAPCKQSQKNEEKNWVVSGDALVFHTPN
jgi:hypothetical protein